MIGAIIGDVVGSVYEFNNVKTKDFPLLKSGSTFTDDTVMTIAVMDWLLHEADKNKKTITKYLQRWGRKYLYAGYGTRFYRWLINDNSNPYNSCGNGCAMRISAVGWVCNTIQEIKSLSDIVTSITHNHYEGLKGAFVTSALILMARNGMSKNEMKSFASNYYDLNFDYDNLVCDYRFNELAQTTIPQAIYCFLISKDFEDCLRTSVSIGGDTDTLCAISCAIAEAYYKKIPETLVYGVINKLPEEMRSVINEFKNKYGGN